MRITWATEKRKVSQLIPADYNPREMTEKQAKDLTVSLERFNLADPIIINIDNKIIGGHQRIAILKSRGDMDVDVRVPSRKLTDFEERELNLRLNKNLGQWNLDMLANFGDDMLGDVGFDSQEMDRIFDLNARPEDDDVPEARPSTKIKTGDLYQLGQHIILCGDSTKREDYERVLGGETAAMTFTDPPYNVDYRGGVGSDGATHHRTPFANDGLSREAFHEFLCAVCNNVVEFTKGGIYICMSGQEIDSLRNAFDQAGGHWQSYVIWVKNTFTLTRKDYQQMYEPILYGYPARTVNHYFVENRHIANVWEDLSEVKTEYDGAYTTIKFHGFEVRLKGKITEGVVRRKNMRTDIWRYNKPVSNPLHPTMKPVELCAQAVANSSQRGELVLEPFGGSGSTLIACEKLDRKCRLIELDPIYCQVIIDRYEAFVKGAKAKKIELVAA